MSGLVICPGCGKEVPDTYVCVYCAYEMRPIPVPKLSPKEEEILVFLGKSVGELLSVKDITSGIRGSKESTRAILYTLVRFGLADRPARGKYTITGKGKKILGEIEGGGEK